jgi:hypothetical protein
MDGLLLGINVDPKTPMDQALDSNTTLVSTALNMLASLATRDAAKDIVAPKKRFPFAILCVFGV